MLIASPKDVLNRPPSPQIRDFDDHTREQDPEEFWSKVLSAAKVKRVLRKRGFDPEAFRRDYEADTSRGPRGPKRPSKTEMDAVEAFQKTGDFDALKRALGTTSAPRRTPPCAGGAVPGPRRVKTSAGATGESTAASGSPRGFP